MTAARDVREDLRFALNLYYEAVLNPRMALALNSASKRSKDRRAEDARVFHVVREALNARRRLGPSDVTPEPNPQQTIPFASDSPRCGRRRA